MLQLLVVGLGIGILA